MINVSHYICDTYKLHYKTHTLHFISPNPCILYAAAGKLWQPMNIKVNRTWPSTSENLSGLRWCTWDFIKCQSPYSGWIAHCRGAVSCHCLISGGATPCHGLMSVLAYFLEEIGSYWKQIVIFLPLYHRYSLYHSPAQDNFKDSTLTTKVNHAYDGECTYEIR